MATALDGLFAFLVLYSFLFFLDTLALGRFYDSSRDIAYKWTDQTESDQFSEFLHLDILKPNNQSIALSSVLNFTVRGKILSTPPGRRINFSISVNDAAIEIDSGNSFDCFSCGHANAHLDLSHFRSMGTGVYEVTVCAHIVNLEEDELQGDNISSDTLHVTSSSLFYFLKNNNPDVPFHNVDHVQKHDDEIAVLLENDEDGGSYNADDNLFKHKNSGEDDTVNIGGNGDGRFEFMTYNNIDEVFDKLASSYDLNRVESRAREFEAELRGIDWRNKLKIPQEDIIPTDNTIIQSEEDRIGSVFKYHVDRMIERDPDIGKKFRSVSEIEPEISHFVEENFQSDSNMKMRKVFKILGPEANSITKSNVEVFIMISSAYLESSLIRVLIKVDDESFDITPYVREQIPMYTESMFPIAPNLRSKAPVAREVFSVELRELPDAVHTVKAWIELDGENDGETMLDSDQVVFTSQLV